jgi:antitoxin HigA-1
MPGDYVVKVGNIIRGNGRLVKLRSDVHHSQDQIVQLSVVQAWRMGCQGKKRIMTTQTRAPAHPGEILLKDYIEPLNLTITNLANSLGVSWNAISAIVYERKPVTSDMALRLSKAFDTSPDLWSNLQQNFDLWFAGRYTDWARSKLSEIPL